MGHLVTAFGLQENIEVPLQNKEHLLHLVRVSGVALTWLYKHDAQRKGAWRDDVLIPVFARATRPDKSVLGASETIDARVLECVPVGLSIAEARDEAIGDLLDRYTFEFGWSWMSSDCHNHFAGRLRFARIASGMSGEKGQSPTCGLWCKWNA